MVGDPLGEDGETMQGIEVKRLHFTYPGREIPTLRGIDATVEAGEFVLFTGPTGCGKSTLMRALNGLIPHASGGKRSGRVCVDGIDVAKQPLAVTCQRVGLLFQNPDEQLFCLMVEDEVAFGLENLGIPPPEIDRRIDSALETVGLTGFRRHPIASLSGGQKQRVALACVCAMQPRILLLDEPTSHLDPQGTIHILEIIRRLNRELGMTVIIATHQVDEVAPLCGRVWLMNDGTIALDLPAEHAFQDLEPYRRLGVEVPELAQLAESLGSPERPLTFEEALPLFANGRGLSGDRWATGRTHPPRASAHHPQSIALEFIRGVNRQSAIVNPKSIDPPLVRVEKLTFHYPRTSVDVLKNLSFQIQRGEVVAVMGANASGKTTLLLHLIALLRPSAGKVLIKGQDTKRLKLRHLAGNVGIVFQNPDLLLQAATVSDEIAFGPRNLKRSHQAVQSRVDEVLAMFDLQALRAEAPYALSRGQRQRTAVAAIFSLHPDLLLLDEPTTGQDYHHLQQLMQMLCDVMKAQGKTLIFCTHDVHLTLKYADRVLLLNQGELLFDGSPDAAFADPERLTRVSLVPPRMAQLRQRLDELANL